MKNIWSSSLMAAGACLVALAGNPGRAAANPSGRLPWWPAMPSMSPSPPIAAVGYCAKPQGLPRVRSAQGLIVESPPRPKPERWLRLRTHASPPDIRGARYWEGPEVPSFVPLAVGNMRLDLLDPIAGGYLALYRSQSSTLGPNDAFEARLFSCSGQLLAGVPLNPLLSRRDQLEVQDIRYADGTLYFNEACQSYSRDAGGRCSALLAVDPLTRRVLWRTGPLVSNSVIRIEGQHVIAGYGFTAERDWVRVVRRSDGKVGDKKALPSSHFGLDVQGNVLDVEVGGRWESFRMDGFSGSAPRLTPLGSKATRATSAPPGARRAPAATPFATWPLPRQLPALPSFSGFALPQLPRQ